MGHPWGKVSIESVVLRLDVVPCLWLVLSTYVERRRFPSELLGWDCWALIKMEFVPHPHARPFLRLVLVGSLAWAGLSSVRLGRGFQVLWPGCFHREEA